MINVTEVRNLKLWNIQARYAIAENNLTLGSLLLKRMRSMGLDYFADAVARRNETDQNYHDLEICVDGISTFLNDMELDFMYGASDFCEACHNAGGYIRWGDFLVPEECPVCGSKPPIGTETLCNFCKNPIITENDVNICDCSGWVNKHG